MFQQWKKKKGNNLMVYKVQADLLSSGVDVVKHISTILLTLMLNAH